MFLWLGCGSSDGGGTPADPDTAADTAADVVGVPDGDSPDVPATEDVPAIEDVPTEDVPTGDVPTGDVPVTQDVPIEDMGPPADVIDSDEISAAGVTLTDIFETIFQNKGCTAGYCHGGGAGEVLMNDVDSAYDALVGQDAAEPVCGLTLRVVPGDPESSILWHRVKPLVDGEEPCAAKMPKNEPGLPEADAQLVYDWIADGALY